MQHLHHADGEIDLSTCGRLRDSLRTAQEGGAEHVVIDLTEVDFIDSTGLSVLVDGARTARKAGTTLDVVAEGHLRELLRITGLDTVMPVHSALLAALGLSPLAASLGALLFAVHPVHTEAVDVAFNRSELLVTGLYALALSRVARDSLAHRVTGCPPSTSSIAT